MKYRHFFWDFDGTLYDTYARITRATQKAIAEYGPQPDFDSVYPLVKHSLRLAAETFVGPLGVSVEDFFEAYHRYGELEGPETIRPYAGAAEMLAAVTRLGGRNYLYTHRGVSAYECLDRDHLRRYFADGVTSADGFPAKPAPDALNYLVQKHGLDRAACIMLGDRDIDLDAGKNAGMACALFDPEGYYPDYDTLYRFKDLDTLRRVLTEEE